MFVVVSGRVRLSIATASGRELSLRHVEAGSAFGEIALLDGGPRTADATAIRATKLLAIPRKGFQGVLDSNPEMAKALLIGLCARLRDTTAQLESIALTPLEQRLARLLLRIVGTDASRRALIALDISQGELASLIGASRPKVNQILMDWDVVKIAERTPNGLVIDISALQEIADGRDEA
jgi:CRP-like cAMP-binding protein